MCDTSKNVIAAVHAGWRSSKECIIEKVLNNMIKEFNSSVEDIKVYFGPAIQVCCYEVGDEFKSHFSNGICDKDGKLYLDLVQVNYQQAIEQGVLKENISDCGICTCCSMEYHSYRRDGNQSGRNISLIMKVKKDK